MSGSAATGVTGEVIKLDRGLPMVEVEDGRRFRCEHATDLVKHGDMRAVIGDKVKVSLPQGHDVGVIEKIFDRSSTFVRRDPVERAIPQTLAANFDQVIIAQPVSQLNLRRLERELVLAHQASSKVAVVLTKADLAQGGKEQLEQAKERVSSLAGKDVEVIWMSTDDSDSIDCVRRLVAPGTTSILIGRSGVGKSTLINILTGTQLRATGEVRATDGKGRHTTVSREIVDIPGGGRIVDMPGVRGLGLWDAEDGIEAAFPDIEALAEDCRFRDCSHTNEPGCAVRAAHERGELSKERLDSYLALRGELDAMNDRRRRAKWKNK